ncbi:alpha/beta fold hydrolase [Synechococcales cyanobacterium C]|uniref:Alpha/beta fold hydrolase n=1 Tax=Petrachloros mirabilis ULC683 TaxID=2781853 RepID=A0A8K2A627_9CYAN|nr:alpha/beta fold hydrolase [Petrachloros mirabilis]NCJ05034.1 alpha/beta fold hydrolase [Petrachloros mirabilis ULC683]
MLPLVNQPFFQLGTHPGACLLLHGLGGGVYEMQRLGESLHLEGFTVQGIQYPGHDRPLSKMPPSTWEMWYAHVEASYRSLAADYGTVYVIGFSTGGTLALHLAAQHPVAGLVLLCPYLSLHRPWFLPLPLEALIHSVGYLWGDVPRWRLPIADPQARLEAKQVVFFHTFSLASVRSAMTLITRVKEEVPTLRLPTLILQSRRDSVVSSGMTQWLYNSLPSDQKRLVWLERSDHVIGLDYEKEQVFATVGDFLQERILSAKSQGDHAPEG